MKIYFVIPWYGEQPAGGAELLAKQAVENLRRRGADVEVLTTCVRDFRSDWNINYFPPGLAQVHGIAVRRFRANKRDWQLFDQINQRLMRGEPITQIEEQYYVGESIRSEEMESFIAAQPDGCRFVFIPYMFGSTYWGAQVHPQDSFIIPCLHDEIYAHLTVYKPVFQSVRGMLFLSQAELALGRKLYGLDSARALFIGAGVDTHIAGDGGRFQQKYSIPGSFVLYVGRKDQGKGVDLLVDYFGRFTAARPQEGLRLVLMGPGNLTVPLGRRDRIIDLGFRPAQDKYDAYAAATVLCQPSRNESFSFVLMEAWLCGAPALVNAACLATVEHCQASNGGLYFGSYEEFAGCLDWFLAHPEQARRMAQQGAHYVKNHCRWDAVLDRLEPALCS